MSTASIDFLQAALRLQQQDRPHAIVTVLCVQPPASARPGDKALVTAEGIELGWIGGGCSQPAVLKTVRLALADGRARVVRIAPSSEGEVRELGDVLEFGRSCHSGGTIELFVDPMLARARLTVVGDSPLAVALSTLGPRVGLPVTVVANGADAARFPDAERVLDSDDAAAAAQGLAPASFVVVATQGRRDVQGLRAALAVQARQVFFVASHRKAQVLKAALVEAGEDAAAVSAIVAPAGQPIGAQTPEEIALSVLAAVVAARRGQSAAVTEPAAQVVSPTPAPWLQQAAALAQPPAGGAAAAAPAPTPARTPATAVSQASSPSQAVEAAPEFVVRAGPMSCCGM
ncbi:MAG: XdhC family protein [Rubrivivax sp.]